jgi:hypothetical protein
MAGGALWVASATDSKAATPTFKPYTAIKSALQNRQTAIFNVADLGATRTLVLVLKGEITEVHAHRNGLYHTKIPARSSSVASLAPVDFNRLITAAGGVNQPVNGARATGFYALYNALRAEAAAPHEAVVRVADSAFSLQFSDDPFFRPWAFEYQPHGQIYAANFSGVRAAWSIGTPS